MENEIIVVDLETTGLNPTFGIVEFGMVMLNLITGKIKPLLSFICFEKDKKNPTSAWIFNHSNLSYNGVRNSKPFSFYKDMIQPYFNIHPVTAFNKKFDFNFLRNRGLKIPNEFFDPMILLTDIMKLPSKYPGYGSYKYPSVQESWNYFFPNIDKIEPHRALEDAKMEALIIYESNRQFKT